MTWHLKNFYIAAVEAARGACSGCVFFTMYLRVLVRGYVVMVDMDTSSHLKSSVGTHDPSSMRDFQSLCSLASFSNAYINSYLFSTEKRRSTTTTTTTTTTRLKNNKNKKHKNKKPENALK